MKRATENVPLLRRRYPRIRFSTNNLAWFNSKAVQEVMWGHGCVNLPHHLATLAVLGPLRLHRRTAVSPRICQWQGPESSQHAGVPCTAAWLQDVHRGVHKTVQTHTQCAQHACMCTVWLCVQM
jgi:hypothetical protein